jgi:uncharacterized cupin superfamily protein
MKPLININDIQEYIESENGNFHDRYARISEKIGARKLGYSIAIVPPGKKACPFHNHRINEEMFLILEGEGTLRFGDSEFPIKKDDIIACPPGGREVAHQIINTGRSDLKYFCLSTNVFHDICEYPDSNKVLSLDRSSQEQPFRHISKVGEEIDYFEGED